jgi:hypothetical protein
VTFIPVNVKTGRDGERIVSTVWSFTGDVESTSPVPLHSVSQYVLSGSGVDTVVVGHVGLLDTLDCWFAETEST